MKKWCPSHRYPLSLKCSYDGILGMDVKDSLAIYGCLSRAADQGAILGEGIMVNAMNEKVKKI
jgi:hypothetical protein